MSTKHQKRTITIDPRYSADERKAIALEVIDYIFERTKAGKGPGNKAWSGEAGRYSKAYKESLNYKIGGKSSKVDMTLSGDMLAAMKLLENARGKITYGFEDGTEENAKADGNIRGTYGRPQADPSKARPFLDITPDELAKILKRYPINEGPTGPGSASNKRSVRTAMQILADQNKAFLDFITEGDDGEV